MKVTKIALIVAAIVAMVVAADGLASQKRSTSTRAAQKRATAGKTTTARTKKVIETQNVAEKVTPAADLTPVDTVAMTQEEIVRQATAKTELVKKTATDEINAARGQVIEGTITPEQAAKTISQQHAIIAQAKQELKNIIERALNAVDVSDEEQGYLSYLVSGAKNLGEKALSPFKAGYGYTDEEKAIAKRIVNGLTKQKEEIERDYEVARKKTKDVTKRDELEERYTAVIQQLDDQIYQQQLITGQKWSTQRKLFWAAVGAGALAAGATAGSQYLDSLQELAKAKGAEDLVAVQEAGNAMMAVKAQERAFEKAVEGMEEQYVADIQSAGAAMIAAKAEERAFERATQDMQEKYIADIQAAGEAMIAAKQQERAFEAATQDMEEQYVADIQAAGEAMIAAKAEERAFEKATEEAEDQYIADIQAAGQAMIENKAQERAFEQMEGEFITKEAERASEIEKIQKEARAEAEKVAAEQAEEVRLSNEQLMDAQEKAKAKLIAELQEEQKASQEKVNAANTQVEQGKQRLQELEAEVQKAREEADALRNKQAEKEQQDQDQAAKMKAAEELQLADEKIILAEANAEKAAEDQRLAEEDARLKELQDGQLTQQLAKQKELEDRDLLSRPARRAAAQSLEKSEAKIYANLQKEEAFLSSELGALIKQQKEAENRLADIDIIKENNEEGTWSWIPGTLDSEAQQLEKKIEDLKKQQMDKAAQIVQVGDEITQVPWSVRTKADATKWLDSKRSQKPQTTAQKITSEEEKNQANLRKAQEIKKQRENAEVQRRITAEKERVKQDLEEKKLVEQIKKLELEEAKQAQKDLLDAQKAEAKRVADLKLDQRKLNLERRKAEKKNDKEAVKKIETEIKKIEDSLMAKPTVSTNTEFEAMMGGI